ncbi:MAG: molecular chaperone HtpG [Verrucomicrobia bacterium]|nr:molecular chaperone HtpG [Verrucomicrobiota bacterium]
MTTETHEEEAKFEFQAEVRQLLDIVVNSLYTDKEIFVRELVSNASDALEKLRHVQLTEREIFDDRLGLEINITTDDTAKTLTISDYGVGLTREEMVENLGTIAHSGTKKFLSSLADGDAARGNVIGKFGVGFYSVFMVAKRVRVYSHSWREDGEHLCWTSDGRSGFEIAEAPGQRRGSKVVVELNEEFEEFSRKETIKRLLERYSNYVSFPIFLNGERVNTVEAIWLKQKSEVTDEQYGEFYKFAAKMYDEPRYRLHFNADVPLELHSLLFVPKDNQEKFGFGRMEPGVALYCRKVLIDEKPEKLLPEWLRFVRGVIDSSDIPLNISRETMQDSGLLKKINSVITKRFLKFLEKQSKDNPDGYEEFFKEFGRYLKEGTASDYGYRDQLPKLLRFESSMTEAGKLTSFEDYLARKKEGQKDIYYLSGPSREAIENGPYLEAFRARGLEVLFCTDGADEYVINALYQFDEHSFTSVDRADISLDDLPAEELQQGEALPEADASALCAWVKEQLGDRVEAVVVGSRLVESPAVAFNNDAHMTSHMRQMMRAMDQDVSKLKVKLEINPRHALVKNLAAAKESRPEIAGLIANQILDNALFSAGLLEENKDMVRRAYDIMARAIE